MVSLLEKSGNYFGLRVRIKSGFTLIEVVAVIIIMAVLCAIVIPKVSVGSFNLRNASYVVASDIVITQMEAMTMHRQFAVNISEGSTTYSYGNGHNRDLSEISPNLSFSAGSPMTFNSLGEPLELTGQMVITITNGSATQSITVEPYTGKLTLL